MKAVMLPTGNKFDDLRIDLNGSHKEMNKVLQQMSLNKKRKPKNLISSKVAFLKDAFMQKFKLGDLFSLANINRRWFSEFSDFWIEFLGGRPITLMDYHLLRFDYRKRCQTMSELDWTTADSHLKNWQTPEYLSLVFNYTYKFSTRPIQEFSTWKHLKPNTRVLEYGCALAPMYRCYREYFSYKNIEWHLADIPSHAFLFTKYTYSKDPGKIVFHDILPENMNAPLNTDDSYYDAIYCNMVYEHLNAPLEVSKFLLSKLKPGGIFIFDYIKSEGTELDTTQGVTDRIKTLEYLKKNLKIIEGNLDSLEDDVPLTVGVKV